MPLSPQEVLDMQRLGESLTDGQMAEVLEELALREHSLLERGDLGDGELREITVHNATVLAAAAARLRSLGSSDEE